MRKALNILQKDEKWKMAVIIASASALILGMLLVGYCCILKARGRKNVKGQDIEEQKDEDLELPLFDLTTIEGATNFFSVNNKLGEGGFGPVYKEFGNVESPMYSRLRYFFVTIFSSQLIWLHSSR